MCYVFYLELREKKIKRWLFLAHHICIVSHALCIIYGFNICTHKSGSQLPDFLSSFKGRESGKWLDT